MREAYAETKLEKTTTDILRSRMIEEAKKLGPETEAKVKRIYELADDMKTKKPFCNYASGIFEGMGIFIVGFENIRCEETLCKASGDDECRYDIVYGR